MQKSRHIQERRKLKLRLKEAERKHHDRDAEGRLRRPARWIWECRIHTMRPG